MRLLSAPASTAAAVSARVAVPAQRAAVSVWETEDTGRRSTHQPDSHPPPHFLSPFPQPAARPRRTRAAVVTRAGDDGAPQNPLFANNPAFAAALAGALERQGEDALSSGRSIDEEDE